MTDIERSGSVSDKDARELVLITGASGFIAAALIARLGERYTVVGLDRAGPPDPRLPVRLHDGGHAWGHGARPKYISAAK